MPEDLSLVYNTELTTLNDITGLKLCSVNEKYKTATEITIPSMLGNIAVYEIDENLLADCYQVTSITIEPGFEVMAEENLKVQLGNAIAKCNTLTTLSTSIDAARWINYAELKNLKSLEINRAEYGMDTIPSDMCAGAGIIELTIGEGVATIASGAFRNCTALVTVHLKGFTGTIGESAFEGCGALRSIDLSGVSSIGAEAFAGNSNITSLYVQATNLTIGDKAFRNCSNLRTVTLPSGASSTVAIGNQSFENCAIKTINLASVSSLGQQAFSGCTNLTTVTLPTNVADTSVSVAMDAFAGCTGLGWGTNPQVDPETFLIYSTEIDPADNMSYATIYGFYKKKLTPLEEEGKPVGYELMIPTRFEVASDDGSISIVNVKAIADYAFADCVAVYAVVINEGEASMTVGESAFAGLTTLTRVGVFGASSIGASAFKNCTGLVVVSISGVEHIGTSAFEGCTALTYLYLDMLQYRESEDGEAIEVTATIGARAFANCSALTELTIMGCDTYADDAFAGATIPGTLGYTATVNTTYYAAEITGLSEINSAATKLVLPGNGQYLAEDGEYYGCDATSVGEEAFAGNTKITEVVFSDTITSIKKGAFRGCTALTSVVLPLNIAEIGEGAFENCTNLSTVILPSKEIQIGANAFAGCNLSVIYLPETIKEKYLSESALPADTKVYAVSGASLSVSYEPVGERIVAVSPWASEPFSVAYDGLEKSIMVETGAIDAQVSGGYCSFYIPDNFEYRILYVEATTDMRNCDLEMAASDSATEWMIPTEGPVVQAGTQEPGVYVVVVARKKDEETGETIYLMTPKYKPVSKG